jgi:hypothetical protein
MSDVSWKSRAEIKYIMDYPNEVDMIAFHIDTEMERLERDIEFLQSSHGEYREMILKDVAETRNIISQHVVDIIRLCTNGEDPLPDPSGIIKQGPDEIL